MAYIKQKGFDMVQATDSLNDTFVPIDFSKVRIGVKTVSDAILKLGDLRKVNPTLGDKVNVLRAIHCGDLQRMRQISNYFYKISGIYQRLCRYMAYMYRYDWLITPYFTDGVDSKKLLENFKYSCTLLTISKHIIKKSHIKFNCGLPI